MRPSPAAVPTKHGRVDLTCELEQDHDRGENPTWHAANYTDHQEVTYPGARHVLHLTEYVTWEPVDQVKEAVRLMMKDKPRD
jgi:hypothetical protein